MSEKPGNNPAFLNINNEVDSKVNIRLNNKRSNKNSLVSIKNWDKYQICDRQNDQQNDHKQEYIIKKEKVYINIYPKEKGIPFFIHQV